MNDVQLSGNGVGALSREARDFAREAFAPNTRRAYAAQWRGWLEACAISHRSPLPAAPEAVADWIAGRAASGQRAGKRATDAGHGQAISTVRSAVAAIRAAHLAFGFPFDTRHPALGLVLRGIAREKAELPHQAAPLHVELIREVLAGMGTSALERRDAAMLALGYCFARRRAELAGLDYGKLGNGDGVFRINRKTMEVRLVRTKGRALGEPELYVVPRAENPAAVSAIEAWLELASVEPGQPLLRRVHKSGVVGGKRLDPQSISLALRRRMTEHFTRAGLAPRVAQQEASRFSGHSLRVGFAVTAAEAGADSAAIQQALGHRTPAMAARYARAARLDKTSPHRLPGVGLK